MSTSKTKRISVADYIAQQINISGKSQKEIADECGYDKPNVITMFKQGKTKLPVNKVSIMAKALGVDSTHMLRLVMNEYMPDTWAVIENLVGKSLVSETEQNILTLIREASGGLDVAPKNDEEVLELLNLVQKWKTNVTKQADASARRVERKE